MVAFSAANAADRSSDGSAWQSEPPTVPQLRTMGSAITRSASCRIAKCSPAAGRVEQLRMPGQRADPQLAAVDPEIGQLAEPVDVDQGLRLRQPQLHHRDQAVPAGQDPRLGAEPAEQGQRVLDAGCLLVLDVRRNLHAPLPRCRAARVEFTSRDRAGHERRQQARALGDNQDVYDAHAAQRVRPGRPAGLGDGRRERARRQRAAVSQALSALRQHLGDQLVSRGPAA